LEIVKNLKELNKPCKKVSIQEGNEIASKLLDECMEHDNYIGLAANQIGIDARVAVVTIPGRTPITLINPEILKAGDPMVYRESCLSLPGKTYNTKRFATITIKTDNMGEQHYTCKGKKDDEILEIVAIQHEICHLDGMTIKDVRFIPPTAKREFPKIGRNQWVEITDKDGKKKELKYKKAQPLLKKGWEITAVEEK
tara:strand:- start:82 stop:672 length:591 start_codon:yes stop_codon:yes gene_type:complete